MLTQSRLKELLHYDADTGVFIWIAKTSPLSRICIGDVAGGLSDEGYMRIMIDGLYYKSHRLAWLYVTGAFPSLQIDHINGMKSENWFANLRETSNGQNMQNIGNLRNNTSGFKGVSWHKQHGKWYASASLNGKPKSLGLFETPEAANEAYQTFAAKHHGEFKHKRGAA